MSRNYLADATLVKCAALLIWLLIPVAQIHAQTQAAMNAQARAEFVQADADLNRTYQSVLAKLPTVESKQKLREAQRAWVVSRDAEAARAAKEADGGSMVPTLRYETMSHLTRERIKELNNMVDHGTQSGPNLAASSATTSPSSTPESTSEQAQSVSETGHTSSSSASSVSPDKQWEYTCVEPDRYWPKIVKAGTTEVVLDLDQELGVSGADAKETEVIWAPDSKRFACNYSPLHAHHTVFQSVAFYQLRGDKWVALDSPSDGASQQLAQFGKGHLPKDFNPRRCAPDRDVLKVRKWTEANTAILYAPCYGRTSNELEAGFLFTLKFDAEGNWKIVKTHQMSDEEVKKEDAVER